MTISLNKEIKKILSDSPKHSHLKKKFNKDYKKILMRITMIESTANLKDLFRSLSRFHPEKLTNKKNEFSIRVDQRIRIHFKLRERDANKLKSNCMEQIKVIEIFKISYHDY